MRKCLFAWVRAERIAGNTTNPFVSIKLAGQRFDNVRVIPEPKMAE